MNPIHPQTTRAHSALLRELFALERSGRFDEALDELRGIWENTGEQPNVKDLGPKLAAETYLRCGALLGFLGHIRQIPTAQERSRNLLTAARSIFLEVYEPEKIAECENYLALSYWRTGEFNEAKSWIEEAQSHTLAGTCDARLYSHVISNLVLLAQKHYADICSNFSELEQTFLEHADDFLIGNFYMNSGIAAKNLGDFEASHDGLLRARHFFRRSGNNIQVAMAENNLSQLYKTTRRFDEAHAAIDRSTELFREIGDRTREGFSLDTKALIYFDEANYDAALEAVERGIEILGTSENFGYLIETIATKAKIQLYSDDFSTATLTLLGAVELAKIQISEAAALNLVRDFEESLKERDADRSPAARDERAGIARGDLKLALPPSISHYSEYQGVWITNADLEPFGLSRGSLAVVVPSPVRRGDLVALLEPETDLVSCGFYDNDFGIVCLEGGGGEPQLFDQSDVKVLGRIVGVCDVDGDPARTLEVRPLDL